MRVLRTAQEESSSVTDAAGQALNGGFIMHGDYNYKPKWSESNRGCELRYLDLPLEFAVTKVLLGAPGLSNRSVDPFQDAVPCWQPLAHLTHLTLCGSQAGQTLCGMAKSPAATHYHAMWAPDSVLQAETTCAFCRAAWEDAAD